MQAAALLLPPLAALSCAACAPAGYTGAAAEARLHHIVAAARQADRAERRPLVEALDSDDPALRLAAIEALERLTGETLAFEHGAPPRARAESVQRWVEATAAEGADG